MTAADIIEGVTSVMMTYIAADALVKLVFAAAALGLAWWSLRRILTISLF